MTREEAIIRLKQMEVDASHNSLGQISLDGRHWEIKLAIDALHEKNDWIEIKTRPMTEDEKEVYWDDDWGDDAFMYDCKLPDDGQEVLVVTRYGYVEKTTFYSDMGSYFENYEDDGDCTHWMPLPNPPKKYVEQDIGQNEYQE